MRRNQLPDQKSREGKRIADRIGEEALKWAIFAIVGIIVVVLAVILLTYD